MKTNEWELMNYKKDGSCVIQNTTTLEIKELDKNGNIKREYIPKREKDISPEYR